MFDIAQIKFAIAILLVVLVRNGLIIKNIRATISVAIVKKRIASSTASNIASKSNDVIPSTMPSNPIIKYAAKRANSIIQAKRVIKIFFIIKRFCIKQILFTVSEALAVAYS